MKKNIVTCSLLIDDDKATNFFNKYLLMKHDAFKNVTVVQGVKDALEYLQSLDNQLNLKPELIFLDINMPCMNGWDFLEEFAKLKEEIIDNIKVVMLSTSNDPNDLKKASNNKYVNDFINKPLTYSIIDKIIQEHFSYEITK
ncbi:response regulator [Aquimarina sp. RZ0]|uniref:response regulator n=1 Tax=Aquimarina sp. RZ0 TaxID=2607730 RepID=UPI0011F3560B|nr:response regulator [Aquimarina sp. RZ0]KAA1243996.1 response regulator [Aquimarina sp. RZ0]